MKQTIQRGFTLVEVLIVVLILTVLAGIGIPQYQRVVERGRCGEGIQLLGAIHQAEVSYMARNGEYTVNATDWSTLTDPLDLTIQQSNYFSPLGSASDENNSNADPLLRTYSVTLTRNIGEGSGAFGNYTIQIDNTGKIKSANAPAFLGLPSS